MRGAPRDARRLGKRPSPSPSSTSPRARTRPRWWRAGAGTIAEQIFAIAFAKDIKVREDADLAKLLSVIEIDSEIPIEAFAAVAEILAYVYRANGDWPDFLARIRDAAAPDGAPA
jgi:flagellar biosynthesis protein